MVGRIGDSYISKDELLDYMQCVCRMEFRITFQIPTLWAESCSLYADLSVFLSKWSYSLTDFFSGVCTL